MAMIALLMMLVLMMVMVTMETVWTRGRETGQSSERTRGCGERDSEPKEGGLLRGKERCSPLLTNQRKGKG